MLRPENISLLAFTFPSTSFCSRTGLSGCVFLGVLFLVPGEGGAGSLLIRIFSGVSKLGERLEEVGTSDSLAGFARLSHMSDSDT